MSDKTEIVKNPSIFISGYGKDNLQTSKEEGVLGWKQRKKELKTGDYVFIYSITEKTVESVFEVESVREDQKPIWQDEKAAGATIYKIRWKVKLIQDNLGISIHEIIAFRPFNGSVQNINLIIRNPFPTSLDYGFGELRELLLQKSGLHQMK